MERAVREHTHGFPPRSTRSEKRERILRETRRRPNGILMSPTQYAKLLRIIAELEGFAELDNSEMIRKAIKRLNRAKTFADVKWGNGKK